MISHTGDVNPKGGGGGGKSIILTNFSWNLHENRIKQEIIPVGCVPASVVTRCQQSLSQSLSEHI